MARYLVGDVQGCHAALQALLVRLDFSPSRDTLLCAGDLVSRGEDSLATLRLLCDFGSSADSVLGNHDLHLLMLLNGQRRASSKDRLETLLTAPDRHELASWLRQRPMLLDLPDADAVVVHAGIPPCWSLADARRLAGEVESGLRGEDYVHLLAAMMGDTPDLWQETLQGHLRLRVITNYLTRMRLCTADGHLEFRHKLGETDDLPTGFAPWFRWPHADWQERRVFFGHWSTLTAGTGYSDVIALDTGCVWGGALSAYDLERDELIAQPCQLGGWPRA